MTASSGDATSRRMTDPAVMRSRKGSRANAWEMLLFTCAVVDPKATLLNNHKRKYQCLMNPKQLD
jgi:hypothetical protein